MGNGETILIVHLEEKANMNGKENSKGNSNEEGLDIKLVNSYSGKKHMVLAHQLTGCLSEQKWKS